MTGSALILIPPRRVNRRGKEVGSMVAAQQAEGGGCEAAGRGGRCASATRSTPAETSKTTLPLPMVVLPQGESLCVPREGNREGVREMNTIKRREEALAPSLLSENAASRCLQTTWSHPQQPARSLTNQPRNHKDREQLEAAGMPRGRD